jgi:hypothetical protein
MAISHLLARVVGPYLLIVGAGPRLERRTDSEMRDGRPTDTSAVVGCGDVCLPQDRRPLHAGSVA